MYITRLIITLVCLLMMISIISTPTYAQPRYKLYAATLDITLPHGDDKDHDTLVSIWVSSRKWVYNKSTEKYEAKYYTVAKRINFANHRWNDPTTVPIVYDLEHFNWYMDEIDDLRVMIRIHPNGNDTVKFNYEVWLKFGRGSGENRVTELMNMSDSGITLSQDNATYTSY